MDSLHASIDSLRAAGEYAHAADAARVLLSRLRADRTARSHQVADAGRLLAALESIARRPPEERRALAEADSLSGPLAQAIARNPDYSREIEDLTRRQLALREGVLGHEDLWVAETLDSLGSCLVERDRLSEAESLLTRGLKIQRARLGDAHPATAGTLVLLAELHLDANDLARADRLLQTALPRLRATLGEEAPTVMMAMNDLARLLHTEGDYESAERTQRELLALRRKVLGEKCPEVATSLGNLAGILDDEKKFAEAERYYREAVALNRMLAPGTPSLANALGGLGNVLSDTGRNAEAEACEREDLEIMRASCDPDDPNISVAMNNLACVLDLEERYTEADSLFRQAIALARTDQGSAPSVSSHLSNLAYMELRQGRYPEAERDEREAIEIGVRSLGAKHPEVAWKLGLLGRIELAMRRYATADSLLQLAQSVQDTPSGRADRTLLITLTTRARLALARGETAAAESCAARAARAFEGSRALMQPGLARAALESRPYPVLAAALVADNRVEAAWEASEREQGRVLGELLLATNSRRLTSKETAEEEALKRRMESLTRELPAREAAATAKRTVEAIRERDEARAALLATQARFAAFERGIAVAHPISEGNPWTRSHVQRDLPPRTAIIGWLDVDLGDGRFDSWAYALRAGSPVFWTKLASDTSAGSPSPPERARAFRDLLAGDPGGMLPTPMTAEVGEACRQLAAERVAPLTPALQGIESLVVIPSGAMLGIPLEALEESDGTPLGERYSISYAPSATIYAWLRERPPSSRAGSTGGRALLVGDPGYGAADSIHDTPELASTPLGEPRMELLRNAVGGSRAALSRLWPLPASREEIQAISELYPGSTILVGREASEQRLDALADSGLLAGFDIIHLATHALMDDDRPECSALVLSQQDPVDSLPVGPGEEPPVDGLLTAGEIVRRWKIHADLVTLSACETGLGRRVNGEGYIGFAHALLQAGARSLLVSLWDVNDRATALLMERFYSNLRASPSSRAAALREAQSWLRNYRNASGDRVYEHPRYWAGFILIGDPGD